MADWSDIRELERLFSGNLVSRRQFVAGLAAIGLSAASIELLIGSQAPRADATTPSQPQYLVLIVLDAFRPDYMNLAPMPALAGLVKSGISYDRAWVAQLESETPVGHATISTGSMPKHDGVIGFEWRDPKTNKERLDGWGPYALKGDIERDLKASGVGSIPSSIKAAEPGAKVVAVSSEKDYAASAMGGWAADYVLFHQRNPQRYKQLIPSALRNHMPPAHFFSNHNLTLTFPFQHFTDWDYLSGMLALAAFKEFRPRALMVNFPGGDVYGHTYGGPATPSVLRQVVAGIDRNIARIVNAYKSAGIYDQTLFVVTADHGMGPNDRAVSRDLTKSVATHAGGQVFFQTGGTAADMYLHNPAHSKAVAEAMARVPNVAGSYYRVAASSGYEYVRSPAASIDPDLDAAYQYLLSTFAGPTSPDVVAPFRENTIGQKFSSAHGDHGGLNWGAQHVPMILSGPGVRSGTTSHYPARLMDLAPTVLRLLGLPTGRMDGSVLADALQNPSAADVSQQTALGPTLTRYQDALVAQSTANIAEDVKTHTLPPPAYTVHP